MRAAVVGGLAGAVGFLGKAIEGTPIGDVTPIDEALRDASKGLDGSSEGVRRDMLAHLVEAGSSDVRPFVDSIERIGSLYNDPVTMLVDGEAAYLVTGEVGEG